MEMYPGTHSATLMNEAELIPACILLDFRPTQICIAHSHPA